MDPKRLRKRVFKTGDAINPATDYCIEWGDLDELLTQITDLSCWLLITGPWQSGKSSLMYALADAAERKGYHSIVTEFSVQMVRVANNRSKSEDEAEEAFFELVADRLVGRSRQALHRGTSKGAEALTELFLEPRDKEIIWFIDEASLLNDIHRVKIVQSFLSELRALKQGSVSRRNARVGGYYLRSFVLVGTPKLTQLIGDLRVERFTDDYVTSSPLRAADDPLGHSISPLILERRREADALSVNDIALMLTEFSLEHNFKFQLHDGDKPAASASNCSDTAILKFSKSIWGLTGGHKGMVCTCCMLLADCSISAYSEWKRQIRLGQVSRHVFFLRAYSTVVSKVVSYSEPARQVILECIRTGDSVRVQDLYPLLAPLNDGVVKKVAEGTVALTSKLLLAAFLEDCSLSHLEALPRIDTFLEVVRTAFSFINHERMTRPQVLNANKQPSEYAWQCEFLLALKFVLENGYKQAKYTIMVEAKEKDKNGQRLTRLDFLLKNQGSPSKGFELQGAGDPSSIAKRIRKSVYYSELHNCEMHYVYLQYGSYDVDAKAVIEEAPKCPNVRCWYVHYLPDAGEWDIEQLVETGTGETAWEWQLFSAKAPFIFPSFMFNRRRRLYA